MLEIYNEEIQDLTIPANTRPAGGLKIRENKLLGVYVDGAKKHLVTSYK
jgi:kinesin family protein 13